MRWTRSLIPTLKEEPAEAEALSHALMIRAGLVRQLAAGIYVTLPLGQRVMDKITAVIREEMNRIGGQEITMPVLHPAELWQQTGRWTTIGEEMFRLHDRGKRQMCLGMTHEEVVAWLAAREIRSYRDLPQIWYQIQTKLRDEARPKSGVLRTREFVMKDSYTLDRDEAGLERNYELHKEAYCRIFRRCGLAFHVVESDPGMMGGAVAHEFMAPSAAGEDEIALCDRCRYSANVEMAVSRPRQPAFPNWDLEEIATPGVGTIEEVCRFLKIDPALTIKSLLLITPEGPLLALLRGDQRLHEKKLAKMVGETRQAHRDEMLIHLGAGAGSIGPVGVKLEIFADESLRTGRYVAGANKDGFHLRGVEPGVHFQPQWADMHQVSSGDGCPHCEGSLSVERVIEVGNIFRLGTKYSGPMKAVYLNEAGAECPIVMGSYGIGVARIAAAAIEQRHDDLGIVWPPALAPFQLHLLPVNVREPRIAEVAEALYTQLQHEGVETLYDDRDERAGVKFKDADLLGLPLRMTVGTRTVKDGMIDLKIRKTGEEIRTPVSEAISRAHTLLSGLTD
ncbi:MAG: proline--tRNA ligase [Candidatus Methylomirabilota bacterium]|nr:proline--tRNA ligase [Candidatus Methylomirabilis sp.]NJD67710.1 proline--tRNA ligase [candidate division NC10 bacterium]PWB48430.1 MAG: proline--tRNA ligase [candidate division NC10 bacterium]